MGGYSSNAYLIFESWLKYIKDHIEDRQLTQWEANQQVKDFTTEHANNKVEFYMGMVAEEDHNFKGLINHLKGVF